MIRRPSVGRAELLATLVAADRLNEDFVAPFVAAPRRGTAGFLPRHNGTLVVNVVLQSDDWVLARGYSDRFVA